MLNNLQTKHSTHQYASGFGFPARLNAAQTAEALGFQEHDIPVLVAGKLLKPLGKSAPNAPKYFAFAEISGHFQDSDWLRKSTQTVYEHWKAKNAQKSTTATHRLRVNCRQEESAEFPIERRGLRCIVPCIDQLCRLAIVLGANALLLSGFIVLGAKDTSLFEHSVCCFHVFLGVFSILRWWVVPFVKWSVLTIDTESA